MQRTQPRTANGLPAVNEEIVSTQAVDGTPGDVATSLPPPTKVNPRTGKPVSMPKPLSLSPHSMSPIVLEYGAAGTGGGMIQEEHEEVNPALPVPFCPLDEISGHPAPSKWGTSTAYKEDY